MKQSDYIEQIIKLLENEYPAAKCALNYGNPTQLLIATMLSAQCTDVRVNLVTKELFQKFKSCSDFANADISVIENYIKTCGLFKNKAKNIINTCKKLQNDFSCIVPETIEELTTLPGVGRKTANLIIGEIYHKPSIIVDTHFSRVTGRLGLHNLKNPAKIEIEMKKIIPENYSTNFCHKIVFHGRKICNARKPKCSICCLKNICPKNK